MRTKRIFSMFLTLILTVSILFSGIKLTSYAQSGSDLKMENDWGIQATKIKEYVKQLSEKEKLKSSGLEVQDNDGNYNIDTPVFYSIGEVEIYRVYNPNNGDHLLTANWNEARKLIKAGWIDEKIAMKTTTRIEEY